MPPCHPFPPQPRSFPRPITRRYASERDARKPACYVSLTSLGLADVTRLTFDLLILVSRVLAPLPHHSGHFLRNHVVRDLSEAD